MDSPGPVAMCKASDYGCCQSHLAECLAVGGTRCLTGAPFKQTEVPVAEQAVHSVLHNHPALWEKPLIPLTAAEETTGYRLSRLTCDSACFILMLLFFTLLLLNPRRIQHVLFLHHPMIRTACATDVHVEIDLKQPFSFHSDTISHGINPVNIWVLICVSYSVFRGRAKSAAPVLMHEKWAEPIRIKG